MTTLAHPLPVLSLGADRAFLWSNPFSSKAWSLSPRSYWRAATCGLGPNSLAALRPRDARERPCVDVGLVDRKLAQRQGRGASRVRARCRASTKASGHVVSIATAAAAAKLPQPQRTPTSEVISLATQTSRATAARQLGQTASAALRLGAPALRGEERAWGWSGGSGRGSHPKEDRAWPCHPSSQGSVSRLRSRLGPDHRGARLLEGEPSRRGGRLSACRKQMITNALETLGSAPRRAFCQIRP